LLGIILLTAPAFSQPVVIKTDVVCDDIDNMIESLKGYREVPVIIATGPESADHRVVIWLSNDGGMSVTESNNKVMCMVSIGKNAKFTPNSTQFLLK